MKQLCNEVLFYNLNILPLKKSLKLNSPPQSRKTEEDTHTHIRTKNNNKQKYLFLLYIFLCWCVSFHLSLFLSTACFSSPKYAAWCIHTIGNNNMHCITHIEYTFYLQVPPHDTAHEESGCSSSFRIITLLAPYFKKCIYKN